jgi:hypothetical protein
MAVTESSFGMDLNVQWEGGSSVMGQAVEKAAKSTEVSLPRTLQQPFYKIP